MRKLGWNLAAAWLVAAGAAVAGDSARNGGGGVESDYTYAFVHMGEILTRALRERVSLQLTESQQVAAQKILNSLPHQPAASKLLVFKDDPKDFEWNSKCGELKLAYTGSAVGSPIHLNRSVFYVDEPDPRKTSVRRRAVSFVQVVQNLVHELGHHVGYGDHGWLDELGAKAARSAVAIVEDENRALEALRRNQAESREQAAKLQVAGKTLEVSNFHGFVFVLSTNLDVQKDLYLLPYGQRGLYRIMPLLAETERLNQAFKTFENRSFLPFEARIEGALGHLERDRRGYLFEPSRTAPDAIAIVNVEPLRNEEETTELQGYDGEFRLDLTGAPYIRRVERIDGRLRPVEARPEFLSLAVRDLLVKDLRARGPVFGIALLAEPFRPEEALRGKRPILATFVLNRHRR